jgi:uncharacterized protein
MFLSVKQLEIRKIAFDESFEPGALELAGSGLRQITPLTAQGVARLLPHTGGQIRIAGSYQVTVEADCDRCLGPAQFRLDDHFDLFYQPQFAPAEEEIEIDEGAAEIGFYEGEGILLEDVLCEQVLLALPMQRVCRQSCRGICPSCGANRNETDCGCGPGGEEETRWSALKDFRVAEH